MIIKGNELLSFKPISGMENEKKYKHGISYGLSETGYDIRIKQEVTFHSLFFGLIRWVTIRENGFKVKRKLGSSFILASAMEHFHMPDNLIGVVHDKSTWAREGLSVFNTVISPGWRGYLTLELSYKGNKTLKIEQGSGIAQVLFHYSKGNSSYDGKYQDQRNEPVEAVRVNIEGKGNNIYY